MSLRLPSRIAVRLLLFNVLLVFLPVAGLLSLNSLELQLLEVQERSMVQQGRLVAAALAAEEGALSVEDATNLIRRLAGRSETRIRIVDLSERVVADSAAIPGRIRLDPQYREAAPLSRKSLLYRIGAALWRPFKSLRDSLRKASAPGESQSSTDMTPETVVRKALQGRYAAALRESAGQRSLTLYSAIPITAGGSGRVIGVVVVSQSTSRILRALWRVRLDIFKTFVLSLAVAAVLSLLVSAMIVRPLIRLRDEADDLLDYRGRLRKTFQGSHRKDEIGDLTRALERLTARLERHLVFVESFSADVSHEFKNPLASIRSASELLANTDDMAEKRQLEATIDKEVARLNRLLDGVREVSKIDAALDTEKASPVDLRPLLGELAKSLPALLANRVHIDLTMPSRPVVVAASEDRLIQAFGNILDNAITFSPPGSALSLSLHEDENYAVVRVADEGPGIPSEHLERIFDRFFSFRPYSSTEKRQHDGLGLAIVRAIVAGYEGSVTATNLQPRGAQIEVRLPLANGIESNRRSTFRLS